MSAISELQWRLAQVHGGNPHEVISAMTAELTGAVNDMHRAAKASKITWTKKSLLVLGALGSSAAAGAFPSLPLTVVLGVTGGIAINLATNQIDAARAKSAPYRYLQRAAKEFEPSPS
jgi:hypothetical protein